MTLPAWPDGMRILCVRLDNFGDVLMTTPAFRAIKQTWPNSHLTLLTSSAGAAVAELIPDLDAVIRFDVPWVRPNANATSDNGPAEVLTMAQTLRQGAFDVAILFTVQSQNPLPAAMLCYLAGIPRRVGYCRENPYQLLTDWLPDPEVLVATRHEVERQLDVVAALGCHTDDTRLSVRVPDGARKRAMHTLRIAGIDTTAPWLVLHPGVSEEKRRYPLADFAEAVRQLCTTHNVQLVLTGSASERDYVETLRRQIGPVPTRVANLAGQFDLAALAGLLAEAPLLIANNTGPVHLSAAVQTPVVVLYAKTNPQHTPWRVPSRVLYFDVPPHLRSRNALLQQFPEPAEPLATPQLISRSVSELVSLTVSWSVNGSVS